MTESGTSPGVRRSVAETHASTCQAARELARQAVVLASIESLIDVGGGSGGFLIGLATELPRLRGAVIDLPALQEVAEGFLRESGLGDRARFHPGDFRAAPLPPGADAYSLLLPLQDPGAAAHEQLLEQIADAAPLGSLLILGEGLATGPSGGRPSEDEHRDLLAGLGFTVELTCSTAAGMRFLIARRLPIAVVDGGEQRDVGDADLEDEEVLAEAA